MAGTKQTWAVVATVDEHPDLVRTFVAWHLHLGASEVHLYFDRPDDPAAEMVRALPQVRVCLCDAAHWRRLGKRRPDKHQIRQLHNATDAYAKTRADWLLHCDADEYLWPALPVADHLAEVDQGVEAAVVPVAERCFVSDAGTKTVFDGVFRRPATGKSGKDVLTQRGLTGHAIGKTFTRAGRGCQISIHRPQREVPPVALAPLSGVALLHFDGLTALHWVYKLLRKADAFAHHNGMPPAPQRQRQIEAVLEDPMAGLALYHRLKVLTPAQAKALATQDLLLHVNFDPAAALQAIFGESDLLRPADSDRWLCQQKVDAFPVLGLIQQKHV